MEIIYIIGFLFVGALTGTLAGAAGIGGGLIYVPVLIWYMEVIQLPPELIPLVAVSTSLAVIMLSVFNSARYHWVKENVLSGALPFMIFGGLIGAIFGSFGVSYLDSSNFQIFLGIFQILIAIRFLWPQKKEISSDLKPPNWPFLFLVGIIAGGVASFFGVGGGLIVVPLLHVFGKFRLIKAIGTSSMFMLFTTAFSLILILFQSRYLVDPPSFLYGSIDIYAFWGLLPTAFVFNYFGAKLSSRINERKLKLFMGVLIALISLKSLYNGIIPLLN